MTRDTVGKVARDLMMKEPETYDPVEVQREVHKSYETHLQDAVDRGKKMYDGDFYVVVDTKAEKLMPNVLRNYFYPRQSCPTPHPDQTVYRYDRNCGDVEFLWVVPCRAACEEMVAHKDDIPIDQHELLEFVLAFYDGTLYQRAKRYNKESPESAKIE